MFDFLKQFLVRTVSIPEVIGTEITLKRVKLAFAATRSGQILSDRSESPRDPECQEITVALFDAGAATKLVGWIFISQEGENVVLRVKAPKS